MRKETKLKFYKVMTVPMLYSSEIWTLTKSQLKKIETAEMEFLRYVAGYTLQDKKYSKDIRNELKIFSLVDRIKQYRQNWFEHIQRMDPE